MNGWALGPWHRDLFWNGIGTLGPALAALWAVPYYTAVLGAERFGVLALVWALVGWFSVTDLGLSRAVTQGVARALARHDTAEAGAVVWSALLLMVPVSLLAGGLVTIGAPMVVDRLRVDPAVAVDATASLRWVGLAIPLTVVATALRGVIEGTGGFRALGMLKVPVGIAFALVPLAFLRGEPRVAWAVQGIILVRGVAVAAHGALAVRALPSLRHVRLVDRGRLRTLVSFGGWTTVVYSVGPLLNMMDRLMLGVVAPVALLAPYAVASEAGMRVWLLAAVILPVFYAGYARLIVADSAAAVREYVRGLRLLAVTGGLTLAGAMLTADRLMLWWVGLELGPSAAAIFCVLAIGLLANLVAQGAQTFVQAAGSPVYTAVGYLWQLPIMTLLLAVVVPRAGALGAAWVCTGRFLVDAWWHAWAVERAVPAARSVRRSVVGWMLIPPMVLLGIVLGRWLSAG